MNKLKIGTKVRVGGSKGYIGIITDYDSKTRTYEVTSTNCIGYINVGDAVLIPVKEYEQLTLF